MGYLPVLLFVWFVSLLHRCDLSNSGGVLLACDISCVERGEGGRSWDGTFLGACDPRASAWRSGASLERLPPWLCKRWDVLEQIDDNVLTPGYNEAQLVVS